MLPQAWIAEARGHKPDNTWPEKITTWSPQRSLEEMDRFGVAVAVTELGLPGVWWADALRASRLARLCNEYVAQANRDFPGRFGMFATVPLPYVEATLTEIAYALDTLHADGVGLLSSYGDRWIGDAAFTPVYEELNRRKAVVHVHPTVPTACIDIIPGISSSTQEYLFDTCRAVTNLLVTGASARFPEIRWIFSHGGGAFPPLANRIVHLLGAKANAALMEREIQRFYFDLATSVSPATFAGLRNLTSTDRMLLGTDVPYVRMEETIPALDALDLTAAEADAINSGNALRLFPRLRAEEQAATASATSR